MIKKKKSKAVNSAVNITLPEQLLYVLCMYIEYMEERVPMLHNRILNSYNHHRSLVTAVVLLLEMVVW